MSNSSDSGPQRFQTKIQTVDGQLIATGTIELDRGDGIGMFWPDVPCSTVSIQTSPEVYAVAEGRLVKLKDWNRCEYFLSTHFHFQAMPQ